MLGARAAGELSALALMDAKSWGTHRLGNIHDLEVGLVPQIVDLCPEEGHTSSNLDETESLSSVHSASSHRFSLFWQWIQQDDLLRLVEIRHVALGIDPSGKVSSSVPVSRSSGHEEEQQVTVVDRGRL